MKEAVRFEHVRKVFYLHQGVGLKNMLLHFRSYIRERRNKRLEALRDLSFVIKKGEAFGIMGPNGSGKSTTLGLIAGVMKPTSGTVTVEGRVAPLLELGAGFHSELTGKENILLNAIILGMTKREAMMKMDEILEFSELGEFIEQPIRTYSSGMLARLGFSVAVHIDPEILLVDEILAVGDESFQKKCLQKMKEFKKSGVTIVLVSHSKQQIYEICDRVAHIEKGKLERIEEV